MRYFFTITILKILKKLRQTRVGQKTIAVLKIKNGDDIRKELIRHYVPQKSFVDIGSMWRVNGSFSFFAESCGAKRVVAVDVHASDLFEKEKVARKSQVEFILGDIHSAETTSRIGLCDVVFCSGVLYHSPHPLALLSQIKKICREIFILVAMVIPERHGIKNTAVFYPFLDKKQRALWKLGSSQNGISTPYEERDGYANWFWGCSPSCVESMLCCAGFKIEKRFLRPFQAFFVCRPENSRGGYPVTR